MSSTINASNSGFGGIVSTGDSSGQLQLQTAGTTALTIDTSQNVGIGTTSPSQKLSVNGSASFGSSIYTGTGVSTGDASFELGNNRTGSGVSYIDIHSTASSDFESRILRNSGADGALQIFNTGTGEFQLQQIGAAPFTFYTNATERMRIDSSGKVGIGMTPTAPLTIQCSSQTFTGGFNLKIFGAAANWEYVVGGDGKLYLGYSATTTPSAVGNFATNGTYTATSDIRKKKDISYTFNGLDIVNALKPAQGRMLEDDDTSPLRPMFIAQDMINVVPALVSNLEPAPSDDPLLGVDYASITPILVKAIQEQQTIINDLKARVETLEAK